MDMEEGLFYGADSCGDSFAGDDWIRADVDDGLLYIVVGNTVSMSPGPSVLLDKKTAREFIAKLQSIVDFMPDAEASTQARGAKGGGGAPICGARRWPQSDLIVCGLSVGHEGAHESADATHRQWHDTATLSVRFQSTTSGNCNELIDIDEARDLIASLQRQLDALDPDAAIAEAERRMVEAFQYMKHLADIHNFLGAHFTREAVPSCRSSLAAKAYQTAHADWLALVEARSTNTQTSRKAAGQ